MKRIEAFSPVPPDLAGIIGDHLDEFGGVVVPAIDGVLDHQAVVTRLASRMVATGMTAEPLINAAPTGEPDGGVPHYVVQVLHDDDIFYVDPALEVAAQRLAPKEHLTAIDAITDPALCFRTHELPSVIDWFGGIAEGLALPRDAAEQWAATTWNPTSYRSIPIPKEPGPTYRL
ncbi:MAG: hypothetical protein KIH63_000310 [Candidatus Saccharibacteria bacterium]|nr:hypothetical protein [Candidatus Saccharibacteria bacterium]